MRCIQQFDYAPTYCTPSNTMFPLGGDDVEVPKLATSKSVGGVTASKVPNRTSSRPKVPESIVSQGVTKPRTGKSGGGVSAGKVTESGGVVTGGKVTKPRLGLPTRTGLPLHP
jgi:hypothetical protein